MKLIMAIISDEDSNAVISELGQGGFGVHACALQVDSSRPVTPPS